MVKHEGTHKHDIESLSSEGVIHCCYSPIAKIHHSRGYIQALIAHQYSFQVNLHSSAKPTLVDLGSN